MDRKNILIIIPSMRGGGAERTLINLLHKIDYDRYNIDLICVSKMGQYLDKIPERVQVKFLYKNHFFVRLMSYLQRKLGYAWFLKRKAKTISKKYDVGISFLDSGFTDLLLEIKAIDRKYTFVHSSYRSHEKKYEFYKSIKVRNRLKKYRYSKLDGIFFVSNDAKEEFENLFGEFSNTGVVYNMIDRTKVIEKAENQAESNKMDDWFKFSAVGSLIPVKGFDRLIRAAKILKDEEYKFKIDLAGEGPEEKKLRKLIDTYNLADHIILHGFLKNPYPLMKSSDVFVMSSLSEALPTVLCEAMILGKPVLVTKCSGCRGLVDGGKYGMLSEQDDENLAKNMMEYMKDPKLLQHYSRMSLKRSKLFDDNEVLGDYYKIFDGEYFKQNDYVTT